MSKKNTSLQGKGRVLTVDVLCDNKKSKKDLQDAWQCKDITAEDMLYFTSANKKYLDFLNIKYYQEGLSLHLNTDKYVGCVPFVSPITGIKTGNLIIRGRFGENISELLSLVGDGVDIEYEQSFVLKQESAIKPPLYFVCQQFIDKYIEAKKIHWKKFVNFEKIQSFPSASTNWKKYSAKVDVRELLRFPNRVNLLSTNHPEWRELTFVLDICIQELLSVRTPMRSRFPYIDKINQLLQTYTKGDLKYTTGLKIHMSDPLVVKQLKEIGNKILDASIGEQCAWRLDMALFFERYVQYLFGEVSRSRGIKILNNTKFGIRGDIPAYGLKYIEPDIILEKNGTQYIIDAKYKMYMYNYFKKSEDMYDTFREDLHQILSYSAFGTDKNKEVIIVSPYDSSKEPLDHTFKIRNPYNGCVCNFHMIGIPLTLNKKEATKKFISDILVFN